MSDDGQSTSRIREIGNCEILAKVGQGGMGTVFRARQKSLDRIVALKILPPSIAKDATFIDRFQREARASAKFSHPHIVNGIDVGQDAKTGLWYFVMEFVDGSSLKDVLKQRGALPEAEVLKLARQIAGALDCLAAHAMVHRDIKPDNIMINERGEAKLADLGLAKDTRDDSHLTQSGKAVGTPYYMSPEQVRGELAGLDIRTDIYALGATLFHLLTGRPPFQGETSAVIMAKHLTEPVPMANKIHSAVSEGCARMLVRMMNKKKEERIQSPRELMDVIDKVLAGEYGMTTGGRSPVRGTGPRAAVKSRSTREEKPVRGLPLIPLAAAGALVLIGVAALAVFSGKDSKETSKSVAKSTSPEAANPASKTPARVAPAPAPVSAPHPSTVAGSASAPAPSKGLAALLEGVRKYEHEHPNAFDEALRRYKEIAARAAHTPLAPEANAAIEKAVEQLEARRGAAADETWKDLEAKSMAAANGGDFDSALEALTNIPDALGDTLKERVDARAAQLHGEARTRIEGALKTAEDALARAEPQTGLEALTAVEATRYAALAGTVKELKERLVSEMGNAAELKRRKEVIAARKVFAEQLAGFEKTLLAERNIAGAKALAGDIARDPRLAPIENEARALAEIVAVHEDYYTRTLDALEGLKGKTIKINKDEGMLAEIKDGTISLRIPGPGGGSNFGIKKLKVAELSDVQRRELLKVEWGNAPAARVAAAMAKLQEPEDLPGAATALAEATAFPLHALYEERLQIRLKGAEEVAAEKAWPALQGQGQKGFANVQQAQLLLEQLDQYHAAYAQTRFVRSIGAEFAALRAATEKASLVNLLRNGDFEAGDAATGACPHWSKESKNEWGVTAKYKHAGALGYTMPGGGRLFQDAEAEPGVTYRLTAKVSGSGEGRLNCSVYAPNVEGASASQRIGFITGEPQDGQVWKTLDVRITAVTNRLRVLFEKEGGYIYIDDVVLARAPKGDSVAMAEGGSKAPGAMAPPTPPPAAVATAAVPPIAAAAQSLVPNGGFEQGTEPWKLTRAQLQTEGAHAGRGSVQIQHKGSISLALKTEPGFSYVINCWIHGKGYLYLVVDRVEITYKHAEEDNGWIKASYKFPATANNHVVELAARGGIYHVDDISIVKGDAVAMSADAALAAQLPPDFHVYKGHIYKLFKDAVSWVDAKKACERMGGHLLYVDSEDEDAFASKLAQSGGKDAWIGLFDPQGLNQWVWADGRKMTYNGFDERGIYKRQLPRAARYAQFVSYEWAEDPIEKVYYFVCEWDSLPEKFAKKPAPVPAAGAPAANPAPTPKKSDE